MEKELTDPPVSSEEAPPILSSWNSLYALVLLNLVILIVLFYLFTRTFR